MNNNEQINVKTNTLNDQLKTTWNKLSDAEIGNYNGKRDLFFSSVMDKHGVSKQDAEKQIAGFNKPTPASTPAAAA